MERFCFPALPAGPPSRRNWYKELLDDPNCYGDPTRVQEAYDTHREAYLAKQVHTLTNADSNPIMVDRILIEHLTRQSAISEGMGDPPRLELDSQNVNCCVIWARPPRPIIQLIASLQQSLQSLIGAELHIIPEKDLHLSLIELSHRHSVTRLRSFTNEIDLSRIQNTLDLVSTISPRPSLVTPRLSFDKMGVAINFLPSADSAYTYHHLRSDMHALVLDAGVSIDMCYTALSAHVTLGRFIGNTYFDTREARDQFLQLIESLNGELESYRDAWAIGGNESLELQLGYLKFGRERTKADLIGKH